MASEDVRYQALPPEEAIAYFKAKGYNLAESWDWRDVWQKEHATMLVHSTTSEEHYPWLGDIADLREWIGDRVVNSLALHDYAIRNKKYEKTIGVKRDAVEDDTYGVFGPRFAMSARRSAPSSSTASAPAWSPTTRPLRPARNAWATTSCGSCCSNPQPT